MITRPIVKQQECCKLFNVYILRYILSVVLLFTCLNASVFLNYIFYALLEIMTEMAWFLELKWLAVAVPFPFSQFQGEVVRLIFHSSNREWNHTGPRQQNKALLVPCYSFQWVHLCHQKLKLRLILGLWLQLSLYGLQAATFMEAKNDQQKLHLKNPFLLACLAIDASPTFILFQPLPSG